MQLDWLQQLPHFPLRKNNINNNIQHFNTTKSTKTTKASLKRRQTNQPRHHKQQSQQQQKQQHDSSLENRPSSAPPIASSPSRPSSPQQFTPLNHSTRPFDSTRKVSLTAAQYEQARKSGEVKLEDKGSSMTVRFQQLIQSMWESFSASHDTEDIVFREVAPVQTTAATSIAPHDELVHQNQAQETKEEEEMKQEQSQDEFLFQSYEDGGDDIFFTYSCFSNEPSTYNIPQQKKQKLKIPFFKVSLPNCQYQKVSTCGNSVVQPTLSLDQGEEKQQEHDKRQQQQQQQQQEGGEGKFCGAFSFIFL